PTTTAQNCRIGYSQILIAFEKYPLLLKLITTSLLDRLFRIAFSNIELQMKLADESKTGNASNVSRSLLELVGNNDMTNERMSRIRKRRAQMGTVMFPED
ncbi:hypothetical protein LOAG_07211, partial [Loa loa]